jgi:hypothetical protein
VIPCPLVKLGVVAHACYSSYIGSVNRRIMLQAGSGINARLYLKKLYLKAQRAGGMAQMLACLPDKCKVLSSNPGTAKKKKKEGEREGEGEGKGEGGEL